jgi:hypothetical protein
LPGLDTAGSPASGAFPPAARSPAVKGRSSTTRRKRKTRWARRGSSDRKEIRPTARRGGGRDGATPFPVNGRRTQRSNARTSITGARESDFHTWFGREDGETACRRWSRARRRQWRGGSGWGKSGKERGQGWFGSRGGARGEVGKLCVSGIWARWSDCGVCR